VAEVTDPLGRITRYEYDENDLISKVKNSSNSVITEYTYDSYGRVIKQKNSNSSYTEYTYKGNYIESVMNYGKNKELLSGFVYTYNLYGLVERIDTLDDRIFYYYDSIGRITKIMSNNMNVTYVYDALGNRRSMVVDSIKKEYSSNELNQYITIGNNNLSYDLNGNLISISGSETYNFTYNAKNQLVSVENGTDTFTYTYDFFGNRDSVTVNGTTTNYYYTPCENGSLVASKTGSKGISYIYGNSLIGAYTNSKMYYYDYDGIGNVCEIVNSSGVVQNSYTYDGNYTIATKTEAIANPFTYGSKLKYMDDGSILYKVGKRYILKDTLAFTSPEQNGVDLGINLYQYAGSHHINLLDKGGDIGVVATACFVGVGVGFVGQLFSDTLNGQVSNAGDYLGSMVSGALTGAAGAVVTLSGGAGLAFGAGLNAAGSVVGTYVSAFVDYGLYGRDFKWDQLSEKAYANAEWAAVSGIFGGLLGKATGLDSLSGLVTDVSLGKIRNMLEAEGYSPEEIDEILGFRLMPLIDPAGYVCESVSSNRIEGVKCTLFYSEVSTGMGAVVYSNEYWGHINPLYSDSLGTWDVPQGYWQVKFAKEGYFVAYSEWLPVPPIQLDVNVSLVAIASPIVTSCDMKKNEILFTFSQYMKVDDINTTNIKITSNGSVISGTFTAVDQEESFNDSSIMLARTFKFVPNKEFNSVIKIEISDVLNYSDTPLEEAYFNTYDFTSTNPIDPIDPSDPTNPVNPGEGVSSNTNSAGLPAGAVVGISIGAVLLVAAAVVVVIIVIKMKKSSVRE
jgi:YD repeat-containing protein